MIYSVFVVSSLLVLIQLFMNIQVSRCVICTNNLGLEYHVERTSETHLTFSINACCPCRAQPIRYQLPMCGLVDVVEKINDITSETSGVRQSFVGASFNSQHFSSKYITFIHLFKQNQFV